MVLDVQGCDFDPQSLVCKGAKTGMLNAVIPYLCPEMPAAQKAGL
jgi:hypothetical protein